MIRAGGAVAARPAIQSGGDGAIPISALHVRPIPRRVARSFVAEHHYLRSAPYCERWLYLGVFHGDGEFSPLIGVMQWGLPAGANRLRDGWVTLELRRMVILDVTMRNAESRVLGYAARYIRKHRPEIKHLLAYSDVEGMGHLGTIYKASGWTLDGETRPQRWSTRVGRKDKGSTTRKLRWRKTLEDSERQRDRHERRLGDLSVLSDADWNVRRK